MTTLQSVAFVTESGPRGGSLVADVVPGRVDVFFVVELCGLLSSTSSRLDAFRLAMVVR